MCSTTLIFYKPNRTLPSSRLCLAYISLTAPLLSPVVVCNYRRIVAAISISIVPVFLYRDSSSHPLHHSMSAIFALTWVLPITHIVNEVITCFNVRSVSLLKHRPWKSARMKNRLWTTRDNFWLAPNIHFVTF